MAMDIYSHVLPEIQGQAMGKLNDILNGPVDEESGKKSE